MSIRFHVVVFNFERISSFLDNFDKVLNFRPDRDRLIVLDCSVNHATQVGMIAEFHAQAIAGLRGARLVGVVSRDGERARAFARPERTHPIDGRDVRVLRRTRRIPRSSC